MRRHVVVLAMAVLAGLAVTPAAAQSQGNPADSPACARTSWVAGTVDLCQGTLVYRDYVYDDYGAHDPLTWRTAPATGPLARPYGAQRYPAGLEASADLVSLAIRIEGDELVAVFELNALYRGDETEAVLLVDADNDPETGDTFVVGWNGPQPLRVGGWEAMGRGVRGDVVANTITVRLPLPAGDVWRLQAFTAQRDDTLRQIMNVAFRGREQSSLRTGAWFEDRQATALADGDITEFGHVVRVDDLSRRVTRAAAAVSGFQQRVYTSAYTIGRGEGMSYDEPVYGRHGDTGAVCEQAFHYFGRYQPYALYVPEQPAPHGVQLALHGCSAGMSSLVNQPGMQQQLGEARNRIVLVPLGRGPYGYYSDISERDVLDALADVLANHPVDRNRVHAGGYSMGGYGTFRLAALYPDLFAGAISWVGFTGDAYNNPVGEPPGSEPSGAIGNAIDFVRNLRHVPTAMLYGGADELVHAQSAAAMQQRFAAEQGGVYEWFFHPVAEHFTFALADDWSKESAWSAEHAPARVERPARVVFRTDESLAFPAYELRHDRAYWVSGIDARDQGYADVDLTSFGCGAAIPVLTEGEDAGVGPAAVPWVSRNRLATGAEPQPSRQAIEGELVNVRALSIDVAGACLATGPVTYELVTDGPVTLRLSDGRAVELAAAGTHEGVIPALGAAPAGEVDPGELPATGAALAPVALAALLGAAVCAPRPWVSPATGRRRRRARG